MSHQLRRLQIVRNKAYKPNGLKSYVYALNKFGIKPTRPGPYQHHEKSGALLRLSSSGASTTVGADDQQNDSFYTCPVNIGTPPQTLDLDFDSGSSDTWVWSSELSRSIQNKGQSAGISLFDADESSTFKQMPGSKWKISYGDGSSASGSVGTDVLQIGNITIQDQAIELASQLSEQFVTSGGSGLLGLAFGKINTVKPSPVKTPVENMIDQSIISPDQSLFTVYLGSVKDVNDPDQGQSFYTFGQIDQDVVKASGEEIHYTPIDASQGFWMYESSSMTINGKKVSTSGNQAIADTGTTLALVSDDVCEAIYNAIDGATYDRSQQGWLIPSDNVSSRPAITFAVGDHQFAIEKEQLGWATVEGTNMVYGAIQSRGSLEFDIMGATFLMCVYAVFDVGSQRFGCVQRADPTPNGSGQV